MEKKMIDLKRDKDEKWIFQKNISSKDLIESYVKVINDSKDLEKENIKKKLKEQDGYKGRSLSGSLSTMGVRFSQMCFYMFGYKSGESIFIPTQTTINILNKTSATNKNMLINLFSIQYPHPYSKTPSTIRVFAGRLILKLLIEDRLNKKLYIDEMIWFLPFIKKLDETIYEELVESILKFRNLNYNEKLNLFKAIDNYEDLFANCMHEINYYFLRIFKGFGVLNILGDINHNGGQLFSFRHGKTNTFRTDAFAPRESHSGYVTIEDDLIADATKLLETFSAFDSPTALSDEFVFSRENWITDLYENELIKYLNVIFPDYSKQREIINALSNMTYMAKYSSVDGKDFENALKPVFELFREVLSAEIISGSGDTDLLCAIEDRNNNNDIYKVNVDGKSRTSSNNLNPVRLERHLVIHSSKYCIVVAPRFSKGTVLDINKFPIVTLTADSLARYCSKECLSSADASADYTALNSIISSNLGKDVTKLVDKLTEQKYGITI